MTSITLFAQAPEGIPYQGVARDVSGTLISNQAISLRFNIHTLSSGGTIVFSETHAVSTNEFGLFSVNVGEGSPTTGTLSGVDWGNGAKFLEVELDASGGASYTSMGTTQMMSVPYALHAKTADSVPGGSGSDVTLVSSEGNTLVSDGTGPGLAVKGINAGAGIVLTNYSNSVTITSIEADPEVNVSATNTVPKWNGTTLTDGSIFDNGNIGIGTTTPAAKLDVIGNVKITDGTEGDGKVLTSSADGTATWETPSSASSATVIAFRANATSSQFISNGSNNANFQRITLNEGSGYNATTGVFTAPSSGIYHFDTSLNIRNLNFGSTPTYFMYIMVAGAEKAAMLSQNNERYSHSILSVTVNCNAGDQVYVRIVNSNGNLEILRFSSESAVFSGHKVN